MSRRAIRKCHEEVPEPPEHSTVEDQHTLRKMQLARVLSHQGKFELDLDQETLAQLRSAR